MTASSTDRLVAVFDMDGVLVHGDVFGSFVRDRLRRSPINLAVVAGAWPWLVGPVVLKATRAPAIRQLLRLALAGLDDHGYEKAALAFGTALAKRHERVVHQAVEQVQLLQSMGYEIVVSTACEQRLARAYLDGIGLAGVALVGSSVTFSRTRGMRVGCHNYGERKVVGLKAAGFAAPWSVAFTDAQSDVPLLRAARRAVLVNPDAWLRGKVARQLGRTADEVAWPELRMTKQDRPRVG